MFENAVDTLRAGRLVAAPTDTVYGLMADASDPDAIERLYALKARPDGQPTQVLVDSIDMAEELAEFSPAARKLAEAFWPGPLTLVLPFREDAPIAHSICGSRPTIGLRWPQSEVACSLIRQLGGPIAASSVNVTGEMPLNSPEAIREAFPQLTVIDGEAIGTASTIAELKGDKLILYREGEITQSQMEQIIA